MKKQLVFVLWFVCFVLVGLYVPNVYAAKMVDTETVVADETPDGGFTAPPCNLNERLYEMGKASGIDICKYIGPSIVNYPKGHPNGSTEIHEENLKLVAKMDVLDSVEMNLKQHKREMKLAIFVYGQSEVTSMVIWERQFIADAKEKIAFASGGSLKEDIKNGKYAEIPLLKARAMGIKGKSRILTTELVEYEKSLAKP
ncbi:MAG: hypothetical protein FWF46_08905 [Oscillospiraceae bacterium]|nr:hypothetical protein [Oscillospiraceae bacterium]